MGRGSTKGKTRYFRKGNTVRIWREREREREFSQEVGPRMSKRVK